ncbi:MAG: hypothetical protein IPK16_07105 [Anaerolineales bacterium]|nr:hypothetical protein [Anaerolineales bacterium]
MPGTFFYTPVVLVHGARLVGDARGYGYITFDDDVQRAGALADPVGFLDHLPEKTVLDEVQHAGGLLGHAGWMGWARRFRNAPG